MEGDKLGEELEHADRLGRLQHCRTRIDRAQRAEKRAIREHDRHRNIALEPVHSRRRMPAIDVILGDVIDDDGFPGLPDFVADGRLDLQFSARLATERDFIPDAARYPGGPR